jgi:aminotransferase
VRRERILSVLKDVGFKCFDPDGAYYVMTDISAFGYDDDIEFARFLVKEIGVAVVPGSSFYHDPKLGSRQVRFTFCKRDETLAAAEERLRQLKSFIR